MSPTSYQAAPPRTFTIAEAERSVKLGNVKNSFLSEENLPGTIRSAVAADRIRSRMHIVNASAGLLRGKH